MDAQHQHGELRPRLLDLFEDIQSASPRHRDAMVKQLMSRVPGQHVGLQTDEDESFYAGLGYNHQPMFMSAIVGQWLGNQANAATPQPSDDSPGAGADDRGKHHRPFGKNLDQDTPGANDQERSERRVADDTDRNSAV